MDVEVLRGIRQLVTHESSPGALCPDGVASALVVLDALPEVAVEFVGHGTPWHRELTDRAVADPTAGAHTLFCDFTPWVERSPDPPHAMTERGLAQAAAWTASGAVVLDHHAGAADLVALFGDHGVYSAEPGVSGAVLAYLKVWAPLDVGSQGDRKVVRDFVALAGVRDTWRTGDPRWREACAQAAALSFWPWGTWREAAADGLFAHDTAYLRKRFLDVGEVLLKQQAAVDARNLAEAHRFEVSGVRAACFEGGSREASDFPGRDEVDVVLAWHYFKRDGVQLVKVSARSQRGFDCAALAQRHGGNGHRGAAGYTLVVSPSCSPYEQVADSLAEYAGRAR